MNHIVVTIQPFIMHHDIVVYSEGEVVQATKATYADMANVVNALIDQYRVERIDLCGNNAYLQKIRMTLLKDFSLNGCEINIINR